MAATVENASAWTPERLASLVERSGAQRQMATSVRGTALQQREVATRRRDGARERALRRIVPMWKARQACYDRHGPIVAMWRVDSSAVGDGKRGDGAGVPTDSSLSAAAGDGVPVEEIVKGLFDVSLVVSSCRSLAAAGVADRLDEAIGRLDTMIRKVRLAALEEMVSRQAPVLADDDPDLVVARLEQVAAALSRLADTQMDGSRAVHFRDAAQCVSRAVGVLHEEQLGLSNGQAR